MKILCMLILSLYFIPVSAQTDTIKITNNNKMNESTNIENIIKLKSKDKQQQNLLIKFKKSFSSSDNIMVEEFETYYEIIVSHINSKNMTGGAECYKLDKKSSKYEMIWHEHPMEITEMKIEEEKK